MSAALAAILSLADFGLLICSELVVALGDPHGLRFPERESIHPDHERHDRQWQYSMASALPTPPNEWLRKSIHPYMLLPWSPSI